MLTYGNGVSWLRTGNYLNARNAYYLTTAGGKGGAGTSTPYAVRPRFSY